MKIYLSKRQFKLLVILEKENDPINSKKLGSLLNVSNKTIQLEVRTLNHLLPNDWSINIINGQGYHLEQPISESVHFKFIDEEDMLTNDILNLIISKKATNFAELSDCLFLSISTVHKLVSDLNKGIKKFYNVSIADRPLRLVGDENPIRRLIYDMNYFTNSKFNNLELFIIEKKEFDVFFASQIGVTISLYNKNAFYTFFEVTIKRIKEGYEAEGLPRELIEETMSTDLYKRVEPLFPYIEKTYNVNLSKNERSILYFAFLRNDFHLIESYEPDFFEEKNKLNTSFLNLVDYLSHIFELDFKNSSTFMINAFNIYYLNYYLVDILNVLYSKDYDSYEGRDHFDNVILKHKLPKKSFTLLCDDWGKDNDVKFSRHLITSLLILIQDFNLTHAKVNVFVVKSHSFILNNLLMTELKRDLGYKVNFVEYEPSDIRNFKNLNIPIDFILSDIILPKFFLSIPHIYISEYVTDKKIVMIRDAINNAIKEKETLTLKSSVKK